MESLSCHCGAVRIDVARKPRQLTRCTCSICRRYAALWAYYTRKSVQIHSKPGATRAYLWGDRSIEFHHCKRCGCVTHYESVEKGPNSRIAINGRLLPAELVSRLRIRTFDGAETWRYLD